MKMKKFFLTIFSLSIMLAWGSALLSEARTLEESRKKIGSLQEKIDYLGSRHIDIEAFKQRHDSIVKDIESYEMTINTKASSSGEKSLQRLIDLHIETLEKDVAEKTDTLKRLDLLYLAMLIFGAAVGISFAFYIVFMYNKRK